MNNIETVSGSGVPLLLDDIDTDRIIPARFLRCVTFDGIGEHAFEDDREQDPNHPFNQDRFQNAGILVSGRNFGCGSSREHAPQSLMRWGVKAVVAESFAEIFFGNCTALGLPCVTLADEDLIKLMDSVELEPTQEITIDVAGNKVRCRAGDLEAGIPTGTRQQLLEGAWDATQVLLDAGDQIEKTAAALPY